MNWKTLGALGLIYFSSWGLYHVGYSHGKAANTIAKNSELDKTILSQQKKIDTIGEGYEGFNTDTNNYLSRVLNDNTTEGEGVVFCANAPLGNGEACVSRAEFEYIRQSIRQAKVQIEALQQTIKILTKPESN